MSTFLAVEIILVFLKSPYVNINDPKQLHLCIYYKCNILVMAVGQKETESLTNKQHLTSSCLYSVEV